MATQGVQMKFCHVQNDTFEENSYENKRIEVILGYAFSFIAHANHGWLANTMMSSNKPLSEPMLSWLNHI